MELEAKRNKFITSLSELLSITTPEVSGCIWISASPLSQRKKPFQWFNYLYDGVLESQLNNNSLSQSSLFKTDQFGKTFHLFHIEESHSDIANQIDQVIKMIEAASDKKSKLLLLGQSKEQLKLASSKAQKKLIHFLY